MQPSYATCTHEHTLAFSPQYLPQMYAKLDSVSLVSLHAFSALFHLLLRDPIVCLIVIRTLRLTVLVLCSVLACTQSGSFRIIESMASHTVSKYLEPPSQDSVREEFVQAVDVYECQVRSSLHFPIPDDRTITLSIIGVLNQYHGVVVYSC